MADGANLVPVCQRKVLPGRRRAEQQQGCLDALEQLEKTRTRLSPGARSREAAVRAAANGGRLPLLGEVCAMRRRLRFAATVPAPLWAGEGARIRRGSPGAAAMNHYSVAAQ